MAQKIVSKLITAITIIAILLAIFAIFTTLTTEKGKAADIFGYSLFRVISGSMEPEIPVGCVVAVKKTDPDQLKEGDIISFYSSDPSIRGQINTHRIIYVYESESGKAFLTKGDANAVEDPYPVNEDDVIGKLVGKSSLIGSILKIVTGKYGTLICIILPLLIIFLLNLKEVILLFRRTLAEEIESETENDK